MAEGAKVLMRTAARTSPTLWSYMRLCALRAVLSTSREAEDWVLHSPRAWLGTAFHRLMVARPSDETEAGCLWDAAISQLLASASAHRLDARFARPERWPGYYLARQRAITSAVRSALQGVGSLRPGRVSSAMHGTERLLAARGGRLAGRPDHFDHQAVTEYKSALPDPAWRETPSILEGYWRQLRLYAVLLGETGRWPALARIVAASGQVLEQDIDRVRCEGEADAAVAGLLAMNQALERGCDSMQLASPGEIACGQCHYQAICPAFWSWCASASWPQLREVAARGTLVSVEHGIDGDLYAVTLRLEGRHGTGGPQSLALRRSVHGDLTACAKGRPIRVVFASIRPDGRLRADISTCVFSEDDLPELESVGSA
jgi:hypothetical protein